MNVAAIQQHMKSAGFDPGPIDGNLGPQTYSALLGYVADRQLGDFGPQLGRGMDGHLGAAGISTDLRLAHFVGQACHETAGFRYLTEVGGPTYCARYDGRVDLGNTCDGDGYRYRGRGVFQLTGRANYEAMERRTRLPLTNNPDLASQPPNAVWLACLFWTDHHLNILADADDVEGVTTRINGGLNGLAERQALTQRAKAILLG